MISKDISQLSPTTRVLIDQLANDLKPVRPPKNIWFSTFAYALTFLIFSVFLVKLLFRSRVQPQDLWQLGLYFINTSFLLLIIAVGALLTIRDRAPELRSQIPRQALLNACGFLLLYLFAIGFPSVEVSIHQALWTTVTEGTKCAADVFLLGALPACCGFYYLKNGATLHPVRAIATLTLTSIAFGALTLPLSCESREGWHLLFAHLLLPAILLGATLSTFGLRQLRW